MQAKVEALEVKTGSIGKRGEERAERGKESTGRGEERAGGKCGGKLVEKRRYSLFDGGARI